MKIEKGSYWKWKANHKIIVKVEDYDWAFRPRSLTYRTYDNTIIVSFMEDGPRASYWEDEFDRVWTPLNRLEVLVLFGEYISGD